jgi:hypothetical protein
MAGLRVQWIATLSNGETLAEHFGDYTETPGERKPWVRLCKYLAENDLHLESLHLNVNGHIITMPSASFNKFGIDNSLSPHSYSLQYYLEGEIDEVGQLTNQRFIDLIAHFESYDVHHINDLQNGNENWIVVTPSTSTLAPTPRRS